MKNINKQLEEILAKVTEVTGVSSSGAMDDWWDALADKSLIEDVIDLTVSPAVLKNDTVDTANILAGAVSYPKMDGGAVNWVNVLTNPTGNDSGDTYADRSRIFTDRGSQFQTVVNTSTKVSVATPVNGTFYNMIDGGAADNPNSLWVIPVDMLYDNTLKIPRYPTMRFELLIGTNFDELGGPPATDDHLTEVDLKLLVMFLDRSTYTLQTRVLQLDSADPYYDSSNVNSIILKEGKIHLYTSATGLNDYWWVAGEIDLNQIGTATNHLMDTDLVDWWATYDSTNFPDSAVQAKVTYGANNGGAYLNLGGCLGIIPDIALVSTDNYPTINTLDIYRQSVYLVNKYSSIDGWVVSERYVDWP